MKITKPQKIQFKKHEDSNGVLCVYESGQLVPFNICRVFTVSAKEGEVRGNHAHKECTQLLVCVSGKISVFCDDGQVENEYLLDNMDVGLLVPPGIWAKEKYLVDNAVLMVLCDRGFEPEDYIREYNEFKLYKDAIGE